MGAARLFLEGLFRTAVAAAHPEGCLRPHLPAAPSGRLIMLAAGKAAGSMVHVAERHYLDGGMPAGRISGLAVTRHGYGCPTRIVRVVEAGHPLPDAAGLAATIEALALAEFAGPHDLVLVLVSGGASANWIAPAAGLSLADKQAVTRALLASGASIVEINTVRKHLSRIKGGRLAQHAFPAPLVAVAISDVPGDDPAVIGSGPTVPDPTTLADARAIVARHDLNVPPLVAQAAGIAALAGDTDGTDGGGGRAVDPAGAFIDGTTLVRAGHLGLDPAAFLRDNNSTEFFEKLGDLLTPGPTLTNVNDFRAILVDSA